MNLLNKWTEYIKERDRCIYLSVLIFRTNMHVSKCVIILPLCLVCCKYITNIHLENSGMIYDVRMILQF